MAFGSAQERLAFILSLDASGAISGFKKVGDTADKELGRADNKLDKLGGNMQKFGAGAMAFAGVAAVGLFKLAQASEEANLASLKLQNSVANNPRLAGESAKSFEDLAAAIAKKTAADDDAIIAGEAMLATFQVTGDQIRGLTPLVVDYARKFGVDLVTANASVGKALDGSIGALKRNGISIDETLFKTDRYAAVVEALRSQVGGFAEQEGATFAGRLQRLQNQLGDLAEGVGVGVVQAFGHLADAAEGAMGALDSLGGENQAMIGEWATYGVALLGAAGATSFLIGSLIKMRDNFKVAGDAVRGFTSNLGGVKQTVGLAAGAIGLATAGLVLYQQQNERAAAAARELEDAVRSDSGAIGTLTRDLLAARLASLGLADDLGKAGVSLDDVTAALEGSDEEFATFIQRLDPGPVSAMALTLETWRNQIAGSKQELADENQLLAENQTATEGATGATEGNTAATDENTEAIDENKRALEARQEAVLTAINADFAYRGSQESVSDALQDLTEKTDAANKATGEDLPAAQEAADDALRSAEGAMLGQADAAVRLAEEQANANGFTLDAQAKALIYKEELIKLAGQFPELAGLLQAYIDKLNAIPTRIHTELAFSIINPDLPRQVGGGATPRAHGGPVRSNETYLVGEDGPELLHMGSGASGAVIPNNAIGGVAGGLTINIQAGLISTPERLAQEISDLLRRHNRGLL